VVPCSKNKPCPIGGFVPGLSIAVDSPGPPHHQVDENHPIIGEMDPELLSMGFKVLNAKACQGGLELFQLADAELHLNLSPFEHLPQPIGVVVNERTFCHGLLYLPSYTIHRIYPEFQVDLGFKASTPLDMI